MFTAVARNHDSLKKLKAEIAIFGGAGLLFLFLGLALPTLTDYTGRLLALPYAFSAVGIGFSIFGIIGLKGLHKGWKPGEQVTKIDGNGVEFDGLGLIPWSNIYGAHNVGTFPKNGQASVNFGLAGLGHGKQAQIHAPMRKLVKMPVKNRLSSTYFLIVVKDTPDNFGEGWELGFVRPMPGDPGLKIVGLSLDLFLDEKNYHDFLAAFKHFAVENGTLFTEYAFSAAGVYAVASGLGYRQAGVVVNDETLQPGTINFYRWFNGLSEKQLNDLISHLANTVAQPGFVEASAQAITDLNMKASQISGNELYPDLYYSTAMGLVVVDRIITNDKQATKVANDVGNLVSAVSTVFIAEKYNVPVSPEQNQLLMEPYIQAGFRNTSTQVQQAPPVQQQPVFNQPAASEQPVTPQPTVNPAAPAFPNFARPAAPVTPPQPPVAPTATPTPPTIPGIKPLPGLPPLPKRPGQ